MNKTYSNILKAFQVSEQEELPKHLAKLLETVQSVIDQAYQDGYDPL